MELTFQTAGKADIEQIFAQSKDLIDRYEDLTRIDYDRVLDWVRRKITENIDTYVRICAGGQTAGYYRFIPCVSGMELDDLYILPAFRGRGIGSQVIRRCCAAGVPIMLYVFTRNTRAISLYERFGFRVTETVGETRRIMRREPTVQEAL